MGDKEQGGMLRTVVVIGIIAMVALIITLGVVGLKNNMSKNTDSAVGTVVKTQLPYELANPNISYEEYTPGANSWGDNVFLFPEVGDIPTNNWRDVKMVASSNKKLTISIDINNEFKTDKYVGNDNDDASKRSLDIYLASDQSLVKHMSGAALATSSNVKFTMAANTKYIFRVKYFNNSGKTFVESTEAFPGGYRGWQFTNVYTRSDNGAAYKFDVESFEAATYDDKYNK